MTDARPAAIALAIVAGFFWLGIRPGITPVRAATAQAQGVVVQGDVVDAITNAPIPGAIVELAAPGMQTQRAVADAAGHFRLEGVPPGGYVVTVSKEGYRPGAFGQSRPHGSQRLYYARSDNSGLRIQLWRPSGIAGIVRDGTGVAVPGASVRLLRREAWTGGWLGDDRTAETETDPQGQYRFDDLEPGDYLVVVHPPDTSVGDRQAAVATFYPGVTDLLAATPVALASGDTRTGIDVAVQPVPAVAISGTVTAPAGAVAGARVDLYRQDPSSRLPELTVASTMSEGGGRFRFERVPAGSFVVEAVREDAGAGGGGPVWGRELLDVSSQPVTGVTVAMQPLVTVSGRVAFESDTPPTADEKARVSVALQAIHTDLVWSQEQQPRFVSDPIDSEGRFTITGLPPGQYVVMRSERFGRWLLARAVMAGQDAADRPVVVGAAGASDLVATFSDTGAELSGVAQTAAGERADGKWVVLFPVEREFWHPFSRRVRTSALGPDGLYVFGELPPGTYHLVATDDVDYRSLGPPFLESLTAGAVTVQLDTGERKSQPLVAR